jgi:type VI secretion system protein VasG
VLIFACAKIAIGQNATPARLEDARRRLDVLATERIQLEKETAGGAEHGKRLAEIAEETAKVSETLAADEARFAQEKRVGGQDPRRTRQGRGAARR